MSTNKTEETKNIIISLLKKLERKGEDVQMFLWKLLDQFENQEFDEKNNEQKINVNNNNKIALLYSRTGKNICKVGHSMKTRQKHLSVEACIICGHQNSHTQKNKQQILIFLNKYKISNKYSSKNNTQQKQIRVWKSKGINRRWPLHYASICGDIVQINILCKHINVDQKRIDKSDMTPITYAARYGQLESVIALMKNGANPIPPPDKGNATPYSAAVYNKHESIIEFYKSYIKFVYNFDINNNTNLECFKCYAYDYHYNKHLMNGSMSNYVYCTKCAIKNVKIIKQKQENNKIIENRIIKTVRDNPSISVDPLCQMKDVKALHTILQEIMVSGEKYGYSLWLFDIDNFKSINSELTHVIADTKIQALGQVLKALEPLTWKQWRDNGYDGLLNIWAFRQGGDEFALVVDCNRQKIGVLQKLYEKVKRDISMIKVENMIKMTHITVSIGVCLGTGIRDYLEMMKKADEAAETVKTSGKNGMAIYAPWTRKKIYKTFNDVPQ
eukprot:552695_1